MAKLLEQLSRSALSGGTSMITGVILARNEGHQIVECLKALRPHVEELILIDMESEDRTIQLAEPFVDRVLSHPPVPNFDIARNLAIDVSMFEWLWFVDADERISERTARLVRDLIRERGQDFESLMIPFKSYFCGQWMQHNGWWPGYTGPRVFKRGHFEYPGKLHAGPRVSGRQLTVPADPGLAVDHFSFRSIEHYIEKFNRYTSTEAVNLAEQGVSWDWRQAMRHMLGELWLGYERNPGRKDGNYGWVLAWLSGQYRWLSHAKLLEPDANHQPSRLSVPDSLDEMLNFMERELAMLRSRKPQLPLGLVWRSPLWNLSGYADESRTILKALAPLPRALAAEDLWAAPDKGGIAQSDLGLLRALCSARRSASYITITSCLPDAAPPDASAAFNVLRTMIETDRLPQHWGEAIRNFDEVWVPTDLCREAFRRSGVAPEQVRVVPQCIDTELYRPDGPTLELPLERGDRFVFLSVFDWVGRKGWDVLLRAYCNQFAAAERTSLLLKVTRIHGVSLPEIRRRLNAELARLGTTLQERADIVIWDKTLSTDEMAALYRSVDAFVLPTRGEGWGRPLMEAMSCGLATIGTSGTGNCAFMDANNSLLIPASQTPVPDQAIQDFPLFKGHCWCEPDEAKLGMAMKQIYDDQHLRQTLGGRAARDIRSRFSLHHGAAIITEAIEKIERGFVDLPAAPATGNQIAIALEGELFARHSFSNINEQLALQFIQDPSLALTLVRAQHTPAFYEQALRPYIDRDLATPAQITIRHAYPPRWSPRPQGKWVHIQPWEFGHLPKAWIDPLREQVDEIWAPSNFVKQVYIRSGIPGEKVFVIPWGVNPDVFNIEATPLLLPTRKTFRFLYVGGTIPRKGIDVLMAAYFAEFSPNEDVCLVIKDQGTKTFYHDCNAHDQIVSAMNDPNLPEIVYRDDTLTLGQMASLYTACQCLVAPYRGEGFGLPILESMACGLAPIVPRGGPSDDFTDDQIAIRLPSRVVTAQHNAELCGPQTQFDVSVDELRRAMRRALEQSEITRRRGEAASRFVRTNYTWAATVDLMSQRIRELVQRGENQSAAPPHISSKSNRAKQCIIALIESRNEETTLARCISSVTPFVDKVVVDAERCSDRSEAISREYGVTMLRELGGVAGGGEWLLCLKACEYFNEEANRIRSVIEQLPRRIRAATIRLRCADKSESKSVRLFRLSADRTITDVIQRKASDHRIDVVDSGLCASTTKGSCSRATAQVCEPWLQQWVPRRGRVFVDVGANVGMWTRWLADSFESVHAIEPNPSALDLLKQDLPPNVVIHDCGAWDKEELVEFSVFKETVHLTAYFKGEGINTGPRHGSIRLHCQPIDSLNIPQGVDFFKCDTEGAELRCLRGAQSLIRRDRPWLLIECHSDENFQALARLLTDWAYFFTVVRNPYYEPYSRNWHTHCWFSCQPSESFRDT